MKENDDARSRKLTNGIVIAIANRSMQKLLLLLPVIKVVSGAEETDPDIGSDPLSRKRSVRDLAPDLGLTRDAMGTLAITGDLVVAEPR